MDVIISANQMVLNAIVSPDEVLAGLLNEDRLEELSFVEQPPVVGACKCSEYNYHESNETQHLIYNTLYHSLVRLDEEEYRILEKESFEHSELCAGFVENGLWVSAELNEQNHYLALAAALTGYENRPVSITLATTTHCNARCAYCYEAGISGRDFDANQIPALLDFIRCRDGANGVNLNWFGGEPLMNTSFIDRVTEALSEDGVSFASFLITNGSLLNDSIIQERLQAWNVYDIQITIDGTEEVYRQRKNYRNEKDGDYYRLLYNISRIAKNGI